jgi:hypothetical protein
VHRALWVRMLRLRVLSSPVAIGALGDGDGDLGRGDRAAERPTTMTTTKHHIAYVTGLDCWGDGTPTQEQRESYCELVELRLSQWYPGHTVEAYVEESESGSRVMTDDPEIDAKDLAHRIGNEVWSEWCAGRRAKKLKITMSERRPLSIVADEWPVIARSDRHDGAVACQANHEWAIRVRQHADGRRLIYGWLTSGNGGVPAGWRGAEGGFLVAAGDEDETIRAIRRIGGIIDDDRMADECIASLPAEDA